MGEEEEGVEVEEMEEEEKATHTDKVVNGGAKNIVICSCSATFRL